MFLTKRFFIATAAVILTIAAGYVWDPLFHTGRWLLLLLMAATGADSYWLWRRHGIQAWRECADRFSNGDANKVVLHIESSYKRQVFAEVIDEAPAEFQQRDLCFRDNLLDSNGSSLTIPYFLTPVKRGEYEFGRIRVFISTRLGLVQRRYTCGEPKHIKVYPSFLMLRQYELMAISNNLREMGVKRIRRIGHNTDFEQIKDYVPGDDYRTINWKATARRHQLMTNVYQEERSQQVFCVIDKGRMMQQAFQGMTLLDYAINASLVLSYIAIGKDDKAGLATFNQEFDSFVPASRQPGQVQRLLETLYNEQTSPLIEYYNRTGKNAFSTRRLRAKTACSGSWPACASSTAATACWSSSSRTWSCATSLPATPRHRPRRQQAGFGLRQPQRNTTSRSLPRSLHTSTASSCRPSAATAFSRCSPLPTA